MPYGDLCPILRQARCERVKEHSPFVVTSHTELLVLV